MAHFITISSTSVRRCATDPRIPYLSLRHSRHTSQVRKLWGCSHQRYNHDLNRRHIRLILGKHQRSRRPHHPRREQTIYHDYQSWRNPGWGWSSFKSGLLDFQRKYNPENDFWEVQKARAQQRTEWVKKEVDADPYAALFGRRLEPAFKFETMFTSLCRSLFGLDKSSANTVDTTANSKADVHSAHGTKSQESKTEEVPIQSSRDLREVGFEFDPISGRMIPKGSNPSELIEADKERAPAETQATGSRSWLEQHGFLSPVEKDETKPSGLFEPDVTDVSKYQEPATPEDTPETGNISSFTIAPQDRNTDLTTRKASGSISERSEATREATSTEDQQSQGQIIAPVTSNNDEHSVIPLDGAVKTSQSLDVGDVTASEKPMLEHHEQTEGLDRLGFLSRRDKPLPNPTASCINQEKDVVENWDDNLDLLRASDIRAAYEARRLSIESEIEHERHKNSDESLGPCTGSVVDIEHHDQPLTNQNEAISTSPKDSSIIADSRGLEPNLTEKLLQHETPVITSEGLSHDTPAEVYRVFAYDPTSLQVTEAETISSLQISSEHLHPTDVLTRLTNPAKFLPCLNQMHVEGHEIVSGGGDILVFRKVPKTEIQPISHVHKVETDQEGSIKPGYSEIGMPQQPKHDGFYTGNLSDHPLSAGKSHRESPPKSKVRKVLRRMLISGAATAGTFYAIGVVSEYFRTGGEDGWGIDGFTEFESERRHRE
ncbi:hypothetical protein BDW59DRAFT_105030 [Aspergillus cavernicola]|uniref:Serine-threonine rich protein n=1 Tax=Aspergillus cavernicola TaxID=176166 RepID=A0ABR4IXH1_9EURO